jgi:RimJ/RimL family protein N-acetyltransferase
MKKTVAGADRSWRTGLPVLTGGLVTLRELRPEDVPSLLEMLASDEVSRYISKPPGNVDVLERFVAWTHRERMAGNHLCFAVIPHGMEQPVGLFQVRRIDTEFETAEWGFALGEAFWGTGVFVDGATTLLDFVFDAMRIHRLEARSAVGNGRGNGALAKLGAHREGTLRKAFRCGGAYLDQALWTILDTDWSCRRASARHD